MASQPPPDDAADSPADRLCQFYAAAREHFGYASQWWPGEPWEITLGALLVQQCDWTVAHQAVGKLREADRLAIPQLAAASHEEIRLLIRSVTYSPSKAQRIIDLAASLLARGFETVEPFLASGSTLHVRKELLSFTGIGRETADCILLYAGTDHPRMIVDAYARRIFERIGFPGIEPAFWQGDYDRIATFLEKHVLAEMPRYAAWEFDPHSPPDVALARDFHAQIVELGRHHCRKRDPRCTSQGLHGWKDYFFCVDHCLEPCTACPAMVMCRYGQGTGGAEG